MNNRIEIYKKASESQPDGTEGPTQEALQQAEAKSKLIDQKLKVSALSVAAVVNKAIAPDVPGAKPGQARPLAIIQTERRDLVRYMDSLFPDAASSNLKTIQNPETHLSFASVLGTAIRPLLTGSMPSKDSK